jgi:nucleoside-diphosphate-sugar epimerase
VGAVTLPYAGSKAAAEIVARGLQAEGAPVAITYPGMVWGPHDPHLGETSRLARAVLGGRLPAVPPGTLPVSDVRDVAAVHAALMAPGRGGRRDIASGENLAVAEVMRIAVRVTGRRLPVVTVPAAAAAASGWLGQALGRLGIDLLPSREAAWIGSQAAAADPSATIRDLGVAFRPAEDSIRDTVRWLQAAGHIGARRAGAPAQPA